MAKGQMLAMQAALSELQSEEVKAEQVQWLSEPFSLWVMTAVSRDIVRLQQTDRLMLSADEEQHFNTTVTTGKQSDRDG